jgi:hypothetical protein
MEVESWLRRLPLAKSSCAKLRNILSVLFNHACRHELFDRNPIRLVRQGAKRRSAPSVLTPPEIKALINNLSLSERTLVLLVASTGLRQSELFGLKWGDINFAQGTMNVTRSIVCGVVPTERLRFAACFSCQGSSLRSDKRTLRGLDSACGEAPATQSFMYGQLDAFRRFSLQSKFRHCSMHVLAGEIGSF